MIMLASNDYLGLSFHLKVIEAARAALLKWGFSLTGARVSNGSRAYPQQEYHFQRLAQPVPGRRRLGRARRASGRARAPRAPLGQQPPLHRDVEKPGAGYLGQRAPGATRSDRRQVAHLRLFVREKKRPCKCVGNPGHPRRPYLIAGGRLLAGETRFYRPFRRSIAYNKADPSPWSLAPAQAY